MEVRGLHADPATVESNMVFFSLRHSDGAPLDVEPFLRTAREGGVRLGGMGPGRVRAVTHYGITAQDIDTALGVFSHITREQPALVGV
jgi:threonine aldolase